MRKTSARTDSIGLSATLVIPGAKEAFTTVSSMSPSISCPATCPTCHSQVSSVAFRALSSANLVPDNQGRHHAGEDAGSTWRLSRKKAEMETASCPSSQLASSCSRFHVFRTICQGVNPQNQQCHAALASTTTPART